MKKRILNDFTGFSFGSIHSSELGLTVVSSSGRYDKNVLPAPTDTTADVPGGDGTYYFGQVYKRIEFTANIAFDGIDEATWRKISQVFSTDKLKNLVFDEQPYKFYKAKIKDKPDFKYVVFENKQGQRVYKGEGKLVFESFYPYAFGFNKYLVRAADEYYTPHREANYQDVVKPYSKRPYLINDHYKPKGNMGTPWKGGYPTKEQVQSGELYFTEPNGDKKLIVDTRAYWENIPAWQVAAQLLVSPTLDQEGELIYLPQYSQINYYNMDTGLNAENGLIGSRILVYNSGDVPIDFKLEMGNLSSSLRRNLDKYVFRISRYNVERLTIEQAVDWAGLQTYRSEDNEPYKYSDRYFSIIEPQPENLDNNSCCFSYPEEWNFHPYFRPLGCAHPHHTYIVEPIPREKLDYFIKLFFWQTEWAKNPNYDGSITDELEKGYAMADRYRELFDDCITEEEEYELYWSTLKDLFGFFETEEDTTQLLYDYIYNPPEFIRVDPSKGYAEFDFNACTYPSYYTFDYIDINNNNFDTIYGGEVNKKTAPLDDARREYTLPLFLDSERRMLYNINKGENKYRLSVSKNIHNDNIERGHWFKLPPGWSLIDISPVLDEDKWGGKRWLDARPFEWGAISDKYRTWYDEVYRVAAVDYLSEHITRQGIEVGNSYLDSNQLDPATTNPSELKEYFDNLDLYQLENFMQFSRWYNYDNVDIYTTNTLEAEANKSRAERAEIGFLKLLANYWRVNRICTREGDPRIIGDVNDWWWYANNYIWENFPPLYWGYADLLNHAKIDYTPLYY